MKLIDYIKQHHGGNASEFARVHNYHLTQVKRCIEYGGFIDGNNEPYFKKYLNNKGD